MRKIALAIVFVLITIVGINAYNKDSEKEVSQITFSTNDIKKDYENIVIKKGNENEKLIALTFDDGPYPKVTKRIVDALVENETLNNIINKIDNIVIYKWNRIYPADMHW